MAKNLKVTQVKSQISERPNMRETLRSLGLKKIGDSVVRPDTPKTVDTSRLFVT
jgi:ribosomal protein L30, bacterial/organelle